MPTVAHHRHFGETGTEKTLRFPALARTARKRYAFAVGYHELLDFRQVPGLPDPPAFELLASIAGFPDFYVHVRLRLSPSGPEVAALRVESLDATARDHLANWSERARVRLKKSGPAVAAHWPERFPLFKHLDDMRRRDAFRADEDLPTGGMPARLLRAVSLGELLELARKAAREGRDSTLGPADTGPAIDYLRADLERRAAMLASRPPKRPGRKGNGIDHYLAWAERYAEKVGHGATHPVADLAREMGEPHFYVRDTITDARRRYGLLEPALGQGRASGGLTPKALALIAQRTPIEREDSE
jgi:hypothetical protein